MRFAYADPPYLGLAEKFYGALHPDAAEYDDPAAHARLIERLESDFDGWAMSLHAPSLRTILAMCPEEVRIGAWVKPFAAFKKGVSPIYAWEPVIFRSLPRRGEQTALVRDFISVPITLGRGFQGAKPEGFCTWIFDLLHAEPDDDFTDLFPGSGAVGRAWDRWRSQPRLTIPNQAAATASLGLEAS